MTRFIQIDTTTSTREEAQQIASDLVDRRLVACAQITGPVTSIYRWKDRVEQAEEWMCTLKTRESLFHEVAVAIRQLHSYECPEIIAVPIVDGNEDYLSWMGGEVTS